MKRILLLLTLLLFLNVTFCFYQCNESTTNTLEGEALQEYLLSYPQYLEETQQNANRLLNVPFYKNDSSFASRNIKKTVEDYKILRGVKPEYGENRGIVTFLNYQLTDILFLVFGASLILRFHQEQKTGMHLLVRTTARGRMPVVLARIAVYFAGMAISAALLYGSTFLVVSVTYPHAELGRAIQSVPEFMQCAYPITIAEYLIGSVCLKYLAGLLFGLLLFALQGIFHSSLSAVLLLLLSVGEFLLYRLLLPTSAWAVMKYYNLFSVLYARDAFVHYHNLNVFGHPVSILRGQMISGAAICLILIGACIYFYGIADYTRRNPFARQGDRIMAWVSRHKPCLPAFLWECKKLLISQKGLVILLAVFYLAFSASLELRYLDMRNPYELHWYEDFGGKLDREKYEQMSAEQEKMQNRLDRLYISRQRLEQTLLEMQAGGADGAAIAPISKSLSDVQQRIDKLEKELVGLGRVLDNVSSAMEYTERTGRELAVLEPYSYNLLLRDDEKTVRRNQLYILIAVILSFSAVMSWEQTSHMKMTLHTLYRGRKRNVLYKVLLVILCSGATAVAIHMIQFLQIGRSFPYHDFGYPVQSIECMRNFPLSISIGAYLILLFVMRGLGAACAGLCVMGVSRLSKDRVTCIILCCAVLLFPTILLSVI